jgi:phospholipid/cholesterol/gamma-HCH transport system ATP-binding protein
MIEVRHFQKAFDAKTVHRDVSFHVHKGECLGLIGGSGVGKSIICRSLIGLEKPDHGEIYIEGHEISRLSENELIPIRRKVAYVFQNGALFDSMSVFDNLAYPLREHTDLNSTQIDEQVMAQLSEFGLAAARDLFPSELSGGMQKRVGLARAIILRPSIVLYDEPTAGLDPFNTIRIQEMILRLKLRGVTSIFVSHDMPSVYAVCDRIALLLDGQVQALGTLSELEQQEGSLLKRFIRGEET